MDIFNREARAQSLCDDAQTVLGWLGNGGFQHIVIIALAEAWDVDLVEAGNARFHGAERFLEGFLEGPANGHGFANRLHAGCQAGICAFVFLKVEARNLGDDIVDGRLKARRRDAGNVVVELIQGVTHGQLGRDFRNRETGRLGRKRR